MKLALLGPLAIGILVSTTAASVSQPSTSCSWNQQVWTALSQEGHSDRQEIQFIEGLASGSLRVTQYQKDSVSWTLEGEFMCSNGAVICYVRLPLVLTPEPVSIPYEIVEDDGRAYLVIPTLFQTVYNMERDTPLEGNLKYTGLKVAWHVEPTVEEGDIINGHNVYKATACRAPACVYVHQPKDDLAQVVLLGELEGAASSLAYWHSGLNEEHQCSYKPAEDSGSYSVTCDDTAKSGTIRFTETERPHIDQGGFYWNKVWFKKQCSGEW